MVSAAFSPDGTRVVTASNDWTAQIWDAASGKGLVRVVHHDKVTAAAFSPDGARIVTASEDKTAAVWSASTGELLASLEHDSEVEHAAFSPDGGRVITAGRDQSARIWDAGTGGLLASLTHQGNVASAAFSPDGSRAVTASDDKTVRIWDTRLDDGSLAQWAATAARSPFFLRGSALVPRWPPPARPTDFTHRGRGCFERGGISRDQDNAGSVASQADRGRLPDALTGSCDNCDRFFHASSPMKVSFSSLPG